jgi:hypothetical protein
LLLVSFYHLPVLRSSENFGVFCHNPALDCIAVIVMPKLDDIMPFVTPQIALLVLGALVLLIVTVVLVTLALRD